MKQSRFFLNRLLQTLREISNKNCIPLTVEFQKDIAWFNTFLDKFNGVSFFNKPKIEGEIHLNASAKALGAHFENEIYHLPLDRVYTSSDITMLEMLNILVAVKIWSSNWQHEHILVHCDNLAVVTILTTGKTKEQTLATIARNIWLQCATHDIQLTVTHVAGTKNTLADLLSRWTNSAKDIADLNTLLPSHSWLKLAKDIIFLNDNI